MRKKKKHAKVNQLKLNVKTFQSIWSKSSNLLKGHS